MNETKVFAFLLKGSKTPNEIGRYLVIFSIVLDLQDVDESLKRIQLNLAI